MMYSGHQFLAIFGSVAICAWAWVKVKTNKDTLNANDKVRMYHVFEDVTKKSLETSSENVEKALDILNKYIEILEQRIKEQQQ